MEKRDFASHCTIKAEAFDPADEHVPYRGTFMIALDTGDHVWVHGCYSDSFNTECPQMGSKGNNFDNHGNCIFSVPVKFIQSFLTEEEAASIEYCMDADRKMLSYAR